MSKSKRGRGDTAASTSRREVDGGNSSSQPVVKKQKTEAERLRKKVETAHASIEDVLSRLVAGAAADKVVGQARGLAELLAELRKEVVGLVDSGWQPAKRAPLKDLVEGDPIKIGAKNHDMYGFIPGLFEGTVKLVAGTIVRSKNGRIQRVLLRKKEEGVQGEQEIAPYMDGLGQSTHVPEQAYGYAPLAHLERP